MAFTKVTLTGTSEWLKAGWTKFNDLIDDLVSTSSGLGASQIGMEDANSRFSSSTVEGIIEEIAVFLGARGTFTFDADASTAIANTSVTANSIIVIFPTNAAAGTLVSGAKSPYISAKSAGVSFTVDTADAGNAAGTETFNYIIMEP